MDSITQGLLGAAVAEAALGHKIGRKAALFGAACAVIPDFDIISAYWGRWAAMKYHRAETHSFLVLPIFCLVFGYLGYRFLGKRKTPYTWWLIMAVLAFYTHPMLDACTTYGTQLFAPLSRVRYGFDIIGIIDLFYSVPLLIAFIVSIACKNKRQLARYVAIIMLLISSSYLILGYTQREKAKEIARAQLENDGVKIRKLRATPSLMTVFLWRVVAEDEEGVYYGGTLSTLKPERINFISKHPTEDSCTRKIMESPKGKLFKWFSDGYFVIEKLDNNNTSGKQYRITDMRYAMADQKAKSPFSAIFNFDKDNNITLINFSHRGKRRFGKELESIWKKTIYPEIR